MPALHAIVCSPSHGTVIRTPDRGPVPACAAGRQVWVQLRRQILLSYRDPILYVSRVAIFLVACIFFA